MIYLDYAAATPVDPTVLAAMQPYFSEQFYNPSALYLAAQKVQADLNQARSTVAQVLGARPTEIIFTAGGTEANNLAIDGVMQRYPDGNMVTTAIEHDAILAPAERYQHRIVDIPANGVLDVQQLAAAIDDQTVLVSVMYANNEIGTVQPLREAGQLIARIRAERQAAGNDRPLYLHSDACQAANYLDLSVARLGVDLMTLNGGKIYGPKQSGVLYVKAGLVLESQIRGGGQEWGVRSGTENVAAAIGFATALQLAHDQRHAEVKRLQALQQQTIRDLQKAIPEAQINGSLKQRLPNNIHLTIPGIDNERLLMQLDERGILAAAGSACSAKSEAASHVLTAIGLSETEARSSIRLTLGRQTTAEELQTVVKTLAELA